MINFKIRHPHQNTECKKYVAEVSNTNLSVNVAGYAFVSKAGVSLLVLVD
jgi:hypothetical protein